MFIPIGDDNSARHITPYVTWGLFAVNAVVWLMQLTLGETFTYGFSVVPFEITNRIDLIEPQLANIGGQGVSIPHYPGPSPIYLTLFSAMFMHGSWMHIIGNMAYLLIFGDQIEDLLGHVRFVLFYLVCGVAASAAHILVGTDSLIPSLGASGAIAGVLGAYLVMYPKNKVRVLMIRFVTMMPAYIVLGGWIVLQLISQVSLVGGGEGGGVAYMAHIGGFVAGLGLVFAFGGRRRKAAPPTDPRRRENRTFKRRYRG